MCASPGRLVAVGVAADLRGPGAEGPHVRHELADLAGLRVERVPVLGEHRPELRVGGDSGVPDAVDRLDAVADPDRVDAAPGSCGEHSGVDLQVKVTVRVPGPRRVVPDYRRLDLLHRHLHLPSARTHPGRRVLRRPSRRSRWRHGPARRPARAEISGCRAAASDQVFGPFTTTSTNRNAFASSRTRPFLAPGVDVDPGDPPLVGIAVHRPRAARHRPGSRSVGSRHRCPRPGSSHPPGNGRARRRRAQHRQRRGRTSPRHAHRPPRTRFHDVRRQPTDP